MKEREKKNRRTKGIELRKQVGVGNRIIEKQNQVEFATHRWGVSKSSP